MKTYRLAPIALVATAFLGACSTGGGTRGSGVHRDPDLISAEEIRAQATGTAYDVVERLRPNWLRSRSSTLIGGVRASAVLPRVFVDDRDHGPLASLREFHIDSLQEISYLSGPDATTRYGTGYAGGIIFLRLKHQVRQR